MVSCGLIIGREICVCEDFICQSFISSHWCCSTPRAFLWEALVNPIINYPASGLIISMMMCNSPAVKSTVIKWGGMAHGSSLVFATLECWWCRRDPKEDPECWGQQAALWRVWWKSRTGNERIDVHYYTIGTRNDGPKSMGSLWGWGAIIAGPSKIPWAFKMSSVFVFTLELHSE